MKQRRVLTLWLLLSLLASGALIIGPQQAHAASSITINGNSTGRTFNGIGALSAGASSRLLIDYPEPQRSQILDYLFKPNYGASLQVLKVEIGGDTNSTDGSEPSHMHSSTDQNYNRGYEWWLMEQAKARNPNIKLWGLEWGAPGWIGGGNFWSQDNINYIVNWLQHAQSDHHLTIDYIGGWNERNYDKTWYENLHSALQAHNLSPKVIAADSFDWGIATNMKNDLAFNAAVDGIGIHYTCGYLNSNSSCPSGTDAQNSNKPLWASEEGSQQYDNGAAPLARALNRHYIDGQITGSINWSLIASWYNNLPFAGDGLMLANQPWSGYYQLGKSIWVNAHTTQFAQIGWRYLDSAKGYLNGSSSNGSYVTLRSPSTNDYSSIFETLDATSAQTVNVAVTGGLSTGTVHVWATNMNSSNASDYFVQQPDITPTNGTYSLTLQPGYLYSVTTTIGQHKGNAVSPAAAPLALPYTDNFESYSSSQEAKYFSDMEGAFEASSCAGGRSGMCLQQKTNQQPIQWSGGHTPLSYLGDASWSNYQVSTDALLQQAGHIRLVGRLSYQPQNSEPNAYILDVQNNGYWEIQVFSSGQKTVLQSGYLSAALAINTWHNMQFRFDGAIIEARFDNTSLATVTNTTYGNGMVGVGTQWNNAQFDNLSVQRYGSTSNVLQDPGFESQPSSSVVSSPWKGLGPAGSQGIDIDQGKAHTGNNNGWVGNETGGWSELNQTVNLQANTSYALSCWVRTGTGAFTTGHVGVITPNRSAEHYTTFGPESNYTQITVPFNSGSDTTWKVYIGYNGGANVWIQIDDCALTIPTSGGTYYKITNRNSGKVLDDTAYATNDGAAVEQWTSVSQTNEEWLLTSVGNGYYTITNHNSGKVLEVNGASTADGGTIDQWTNVNQSNEQWQLVDIGDGYYKIVNRNSGKLVEVVGSSPSDGVAIDQRGDLNQPNQQWSLVQA